MFRIMSRMGELQEKLLEARRRRGWTVAGATTFMPGVGDSTLLTLEGRNPRRTPAEGGEMKLKTAVAIVAAYWPDVTLLDLMGARLPCLLSFKIRNAPSRRTMQKYQPPRLAERDCGWT